MRGTAQRTPTSEPRSIGIVAPLLAATMLAAINLLIWYPGESNSDSNSQFAQISTGILNDWHPPAMTRLWEFLLFFGPGTAPLYVLNVLLYWAAPALLAVTLIRIGHRLTGWAILAVFGLPTFIMQNINITKDVHFAVVLLIAFALTFFYLARGRNVPIAAKAAIIILIFYGMLVRINGVFVVLPLMVYALGWRSLQGPIKLVSLTLVAGAALVPVANFVNHRLLFAHDAGAIRSLELFDLSGIAEHSGDMAVFGRASTLGRRELDRCYSPIMWDTLEEKGRCPDLIPRIGRHREDAFVGLPPLGDLWPAAIMRHPEAYATHRLANFNSATYFVEPMHHLDAVRVFDTAYSRKPSLKNRLLDLVRYFPPLMPGVLLALGVGLAVLLLGDGDLRRHAQPLGIVTLEVSALSYGFSFLIVGVATDLRYFFFSDLAILTAAALTVMIWRSRGRPARVSPSLLAGTSVFFGALVVTCAARLGLPPPPPVVHASGKSVLPSAFSADRSEKTHVQTSPS